MVMTPEQKARADLAYRRQCERQSRCKQAATTQHTYRAHELEQLERIAESFERIALACENLCTFMEMR